MFEGVNEWRKNALFVGIRTGHRPYLSSGITGTVADLYLALFWPGTSLANIAAKIELRKVFNRSLSIQEDLKEKKNAVACADFFMQLSIIGTSGLLNCNDHTKLLHYIDCTFPFFYPH